MFWLFWLVLMPLVFWLPALIGAGAYWVTGKMNVSDNAQAIATFIGAVIGLAATIMLLQIDFSPWGISTHVTDPLGRAASFFLGLIQLAGWVASVAVLGLSGITAYDAVLKIAHKS